MKNTRYGGRAGAGPGLPRILRIFIAQGADKSKANPDNYKANPE